jgi:hypothetical protein
MMARTQVTLSPEEHRRARAKAADLGISLAEYIRSLVRRDLGHPRPRGDISSIFNLGDSGGSDISRYKDEYVGEAVEAAWKRDTPRRE